VTAADAARLRAVALAYPEATEDFPWGHTAVKVRGKAFLFLSGEAGTLSVTCKLPASHGAALLLPFASPTGYGLGKSGWVTASFPEAQAAPVELLAEWIGESYRAVAPKKLAALVEGDIVAVSKVRSAGTGVKKAAKKATKKAAKKVAAGAKKAAKAGAVAKGRASGTGAKRAAVSGRRAG
jgi:predicted DNA-binding protein (MmcQ/YjbR family)